MKKIIAPIIFLAIVLAVGYFWQQKQAPVATNQNVNQNNNQNTNQNQEADYAYLVTFEFDNQDTTSVEYPYDLPLDQSLLAITSELARTQNWQFDSKEYEGLGTLITSIRDKANGDQQKYWQYYVNDVQPQVSADKYYPARGEHIIWKFKESEL